MYTILVSVFSSVPLVFPVDGGEVCALEDGVFSISIGLIGEGVFW